MFRSAAASLAQDAKPHTVVHDEAKFVLVLELHDLFQGTLIAIVQVQAFDHDETAIQLLLGLGISGGNLLQNALQVSRIVVFEEDHLTLGQHQTRLHVKVHTLIAASPKTNENTLKIDQGTH